MNLLLAKLFEKACDIDIVVPVKDRQYANVKKTQATAFQRFKMAVSRHGTVYL